MFARSLEALPRSIPEPPPVHAARYQAELRQKLAARQERSARTWWRWPVPLALSAGLTTILLFLALHGGLRPGERQDGIALDNAIAPRLELLRDYQLVERLDLLEDFDILKTLANPAGSRES